MSYIPKQDLDDLKLRPNGHRYHYSSTRHFFRKEDLPRLRALVPELKPATVSIPREDGSVEQVSDSIRATRVGFIDPTPDSEWLYQLITTGIKFHNMTYYNFAIEGIETLQFSEYPAGEGYYKPHLDWGAGGLKNACRKLSFTIQLSDPASYEGGDLTFAAGNPADFPAMREFGCLTVFPSWMLHEVTPVTTGTRRSLVGWCVGPDFF